MVGRRSVKRRVSDFLEASVGREEEAILGSPSPSPGRGTFADLKQCTKGHRSRKGTRHREIFIRLRPTLSLVLFSSVILFCTVYWLICFLCFLFKVGGHAPYIFSLGETPFSFGLADFCFHLLEFFLFLVFIKLFNQSTHH